MAKKKHPRHPKEHDLLKAIRRTPPDVGGELAGAKKSARPKKKRSK
ncbi:MAG: hypothetical protein AB7N65_29805 [Vicinamibacterales bacterium]